MNVKWKERITNPYFWIGVVATIIAASGVDAETLTNWPVVWQSIVAVVSDPIRISAVVIAIVGIIYDPTTKGFITKK